MTSLFNSSITRTVHCLLIQEPYLHWANHLPKTDPNWHMVPPLMNLDPSSTGDSRVKGVVYINTQLPSHSFSPISTNSPLIAGAPSPTPPTPPPLSLHPAGSSPRNAPPQTHSCVPQTEPGPARHGFQPTPRTVESNHLPPHPLRSRGPNLSHERGRSDAAIGNRSANMQLQPRKSGGDNCRPAVDIPGLLRLGNDLQNRHVLRARSFLRSSSHHHQARPPVKPALSDPTQVQAQLEQDGLGAVLNHAQCTPLTNLEGVHAVGSAGRGHSRNPNHISNQTSHPSLDPDPHHHAEIETLVERGDSEPTQKKRQPPTQTSATHQSTGG